MKRFFCYIALYLLLLFSSNAAFSQFGQNKVQYRTFDWKFIQTQHFDIYFYDNATELADFCAIHAEKALQSIETTLNYQIEKRVPIIIYNSKNEFQQTNTVNTFLPEGIGGVTELFKNRVILPFLGDLRQFRHVIHHELVHAVLNNLFYAGTFQSAVSTGNTLDIPIWMNEGLAEYESIGELDTETDVFMRDLALSENLVNIENISGYLSYRAGQSFYWYIDEKYGKDRIGELINRYKVIGRLNEAFKSTFNKDVEEFSEEWKKAVKRYYLPDIEKYKNPDEFSERLTFAKKERTYYNSSPAISPDGKRFAYISAKDGLTYGIYIQSLDNRKDVEKLVSSFRQQDFEELNILTPGISWSPDAKKLAISAKAGGEDAIYIVNSDNGDYEKLLFNLASITSVSWSPDGKKLAFIGSGPKGSDLYVHNLQSKKTENLTKDLLSDHNPVWSWDSQRIFFLSDRGNILNSRESEQIRIRDMGLPRPDIFSYNLSDNTISRITNSPGLMKTSYVLSPDNKRMLYVSDKNGISNIYLLELESGKEKPITNSLNGITQLTITPDGIDLLFASQVDIGFDIYRLRNPFELTIDRDTLINTKLREAESEKALAKERITQFSNNESDSGQVVLKGYGNFEIEFSRQQIVKANPDAIRIFKDASTQYQSPDSAFVPKDYRISFTPDVVMSNPSVNTFYGFQGSFQMLFSDLMSNHQIYLAANLWLDLKNSNIFGAYSYLSKIIDYQFAGYHNSIFNYGSGNQLLRFRNYGAMMTASYPFDLFRRLEWGLKWSIVSRENVSIPSDPSMDRMLFIPNVKFVFDNALWGYTSPIKGSRYFINIMASPKLTNNGLSFIKIDFDHRYYLPIVTNYLTFVNRIAGGTSLGPNPQRSFLGGTENWINSTFLYGRLPFENPEDFEFTQIIMPLRGHPVNSIRGSHYFLINTEIRFPILAAIATGPLPVLLHNITGVGFIDIGGAWSGPYSSFKSAIKDNNGNPIPNNLRMAIGTGIRSILLGLPFKLDIAWRNEFTGWSKPEYMFSLGFDF
jgi:Tol biopolymer transport system component